MSETSRPDTAPVSNSEQLYCANHPTVPTILRCNRCGKPICVKCAVLTPVGYRCKECVRGQQSAFYNAGISDYVIAVIVTLPMALIAGYIASLVGRFLWFLLIFAGPIAGTVMADMTHRAVGRRRGRYLWLVVCACIVVGTLPFMLGGILTLLVLLSGVGTTPAVAAYGLGYLLPLGFMLFYLVLAVATAYSRLRFGR